LCAPRLLLFASPRGLARAWPGRHVALLAVAVAFAMTDPQDRALALFAPAALLVCGASRGPERPVERPRRPAPLFVSVALLNCLLAPILGLQDLGSPVMYSNLKLHAGSNHLLVPTSTRDVVRLDRASSPFVRRYYPGELRLEPPRTLHILDRFGYYAPRFFNTAKPFVLGPARSSATAFVPFTLPVLGFRMLLATARRYSAEPFDLLYSHLPPPPLDERARAVAAVRTVAAAFDADGRLASCAVLSPDGNASLPCDPDADLVALPDPPRSLHRLVFYLAYPVVRAPPTAHSGPVVTPQIMCFGP